MVKLFKMKKLLFVALFFFAAQWASAQRWCYVSSEYILNKMPEYSAAQKQVDALSETWAKEIETRSADIAKMYRTLEAEKALLTEEMLKRRKSEIVLLLSGESLNGVVHFVLNGFDHFLFLFEKVALESESLLLKIAQLFFFEFDFGLSSFQHFLG